MTSRVMIFGVGSFAHSVMSILNQYDVEVSCYLTRSYGHYGPSLIGKTWKSDEFNSPIDLIKKFEPDLIIPMSIEWTEKNWSKKFIQMNIPF